MPRRRGFLLVLAVLMLLFVMPSAAAEEPNLLVNGSFEELNAKGLPDGWKTEAYVTTEGVSLYSVTGDAFDGLNAAVVSNLGMNDARFAQTVAVEPDSLYCLSGWIRADGIEDRGRGANLSVSGVYAFSQSLFETDGEWVYVELYGETGPDQYEVTVFARVGGYSGESIGEAAFDDLSLRKVDVIPAATEIEPWYTRKVSYAGNDAGAEEVTEEPAEPYRSQLVGFSLLYVLLAGFVLYRTQLRSGADTPLNETLKRRSGRSFPWLLAAGLLLAAALRVVVALNVVGYQVDVGCFTSWGYTVYEYHPWGFYQAASFCDYPPGYIYAMGFSEGLNRTLSEWLEPVLMEHPDMPLWKIEALEALINPAFAHKVIPMLCDLLAALLVWHIASTRGWTRQNAALAALMLAFNPAVILNSAAWCQVDSVLCLLLMLVAWLAIRRRWAVVLPVYVLSILIKPQALMMGFLGLAAIVVEMVRTAPKFVKDGNTGKRRLTFHKSWKQLGVGVLASLAVALIVVIPFSIGNPSLTWLIELYGDTLSSYPYATVNTANLYYLFDGNWSPTAETASQPVTLLFMLLCTVWTVVAFCRRRDRKLTWLEPLIAALLILAVVFGVLGAMPLMAGEGEDILLTTGNPWYVARLNDENVRFFNGYAEDAWTMEIDPLALIGVAALLLAAAVCGVYYLYLQLKRGQQKRIHTGLLEPVVMLLFALTFLLMLIFDTTWGQLGVAAMALAFAIVLPMFIRSGKLEMLPLCGAVLFILLYVFGVKMHERYLFPGLFLLGMAYVLRRDRRLMWLLVGFTATMFLNEGIVLDNSIRLGSASGHLNPDTNTLADWLSMANVALALWSVWLCQRICVEDQPARLRGTKDEPLYPVRERGDHPCNPLTFKAESKVKWGRLDAILIGAVTLIYSVVTLTTLGSTKAPQNAWKSTNPYEQVIIDLGDQYEDFHVMYNCQVSYNNFTIALSPDNVTWPQDQVYWLTMDQGQCFRWLYLDEYDPEILGQAPVDLSGRYVCLTAHQAALAINEIVFLDSEGNVIPAKVHSTINARTESPLYSDAALLLDEQDTYTGDPSWWNGTYFDEIYHARTAFEHMNGTVPYETSHPPLGKVIMSWCVSIFGMTPFGWRFAGALCGILMLPAMYAIAKQLTRRTDLAFAAMMMMALDCMHFTQTRIATIDSFPVLFIILSYFFMLRFMQRDIVREKLRRVLPDLALSGFFMGCGVASKWIGVYAGAGLAVLYFWTCLRHCRMAIESARQQKAEGKRSAADAETLRVRDRESLRRVFILCLWCLVFFVAVPVIIYLLSYIPYFRAWEFQSLPEYLRIVTRDSLRHLAKGVKAFGGYQVLLAALSCFFMLRLVRRDIAREPIKRLLPDLALCAFFAFCDVTSGWLYAGVGAILAAMYAAACLRSFLVSMPEGKRRLAWDKAAAMQLLYLTLIGLALFLVIPSVVLHLYSLVKEMPLCGEVSGWLYAIVGGIVAALYVVACVRIFLERARKDKKPWLLDKPAAKRLLYLTLIGLALYLVLISVALLVYCLVKERLCGFLIFWKYCFTAPEWPAVPAALASCALMLCLTRLDFLRQKKMNIVLMMLVTSAAAMLAVKFDLAMLMALPALAVIFGWKCTAILRENRSKSAIRRVCILCLWFLLIFVVLPLIVWILTFGLNHRAAYPQSPIEFVKAVWEAQVGMFEYHSKPGLGMDHPFYSPWYEWPLMLKPMYYAMDTYKPDGMAYAIFCFGNPAVWYVGIAGIAYTVYRWLKSHRYRLADRPGTWHLYADTWSVANAFVLIGLLAQFLPWVLVPRGTYIYHYFASIPFLILGTVLLLDRLCRRWPKARWWIIGAYLALCLAYFVILFPYASGLSTDVAWMDWVNEYPWLDEQIYEGNDFAVVLNEFLTKFPLLPHVYH